MRLTYLLPAPMHVTELGEAEMRRRADLLKQWASAETTISVAAVDSGPASIESAYEEYLAIPAMARRLTELERAGSDVTIIGCFGDPGLDGLRELAGRPVVGPAGAAMSLATTLGHHFSVVTVTESVRPLLRRLAWETGVLSAMCAVRAVELPVKTINEDRERAHSALRTECQNLLDTTDTDTIVLGCMSMGFLGAAERLTAELGVPVLNPVRAAVQQAEALHRMGLRHSPRAYRRPPKLADGAEQADLLRRSPNPLEVLA